MTKHRRGPWAQAEDRTLLLLVEKYGPQNWVRISQDLNSRSPKQCRERYHQNLKPTLNLEPISADEGMLIERLVSEMGKKWAEIARRLRGRSDNAVKNWWNGGMNRRKRLDRGATAASATHDIRAYQYQSHSVRLPIGPSVQMPYPNQPAQKTKYSDGPASSISNKFPPSLQSLHILPSNTAYPPRLLDPSLPSPSAVSSTSRSESLDGGAPPSLVSDYSTSSNSTSPYSRTPGTELVSLLIDGNRTRRESVPVVRTTPTTRPHIPEEQSVRSSSASSTKSPSTFQTFAFPYPTQFSSVGSSDGSIHTASTTYVNPRRDTRYSNGSKTGTLTGRIAPVQRPLPDFRTIIAPDLRIPEPASPPRDSRMNLSNVML